MCPSLTSHAGPRRTLKDSRIYGFQAGLKATDEPVKYKDARRQYRFEGLEAVAQLEATIRVPSIDFTFKTDLIEASESDFALMGREVNGNYYEVAKG
jgi:hypothetical protein